MELPPYRMPVLKATAIHMWEKGRLFLTRAGTVILAGATLVWFLSHYPGITNRAWSRRAPGAGGGHPRPEAGPGGGDRTSWRSWTWPPRAGS